MRREQRLRHLARPAEPGRPAYQPVRVDAARRAADALEAELHALHPADLGDRGVEPARPVLAAEFADDVVRPRHPGARHVGVEQERPPGQVEQQVGPAPQGSPQPAHPEEAPGADQIVHDLDPQRAFGGARIFKSAVLAQSQSGHHRVTGRMGADSSTVLLDPPVFKIPKHGGRRSAAAA